MHSLPAFREERRDVLHAMIRAYPLATLITYGTNGLTANLIPFTLIDDADRGTLRAHLAKANEQLADLRVGAEALVIFQGPQAYVSPSWYATKRDHGKVVPTWNYVVVQARGAPCLHEDAEWLRAQIDRLTAEREATRAEPWQVADAPADFVEGQLTGIVGLEIPIARIEGKWKVSQNQPERNRQGVVRGLREDDGLHAMAEAVERAAD